MNKGMWLFLKYTAIFSEAVVGIVFSFALYNFLLGDGLTKKADNALWEGITLSVFFIISIHFIMNIHERALPYIEQKLEQFTE